MIDELDKMGIVTASDGAKCIFTPLCKPAAEGGKGLPPLMVQKSDGGYGYDSTDVAAIKYRLHELDADWLVYVTDLGQQTHFDSVFAAARMAGWDDKGAAKGGKARLKWVGQGYFDQLRQVSTPRVVTEFKDTDFVTLFIGYVE